MTAPWATLAAGALAGALLAGGVQQYRIMSAQKALSDARLEFAQQVTDAQAAHVLAQAEARRIEQDARDRERGLQDTINQINQEAHDAQQDYDRLIVSAGTERQRLLDAVAAADARAGDSHKTGADASTASQCTTALDSLRVLAQLLGESDQQAGIYATQADKSRAAGLACERAYDAARAVVNRD